MKIGYVANGPFAAAAVRRLLRRHQVLAFSPAKDRTLEDAGAAAAPNLSQLARSSDVVIVCLGSQVEVRDVLFGSEGLAEGFSAGRIVVDQTPGTPDEARMLAEELRERGVALLDAPIHAEAVDAAPETTVMMCGGPVDAFESVRSVLTCMCPNLVYCGDSGTGRAAKLVVAAVAACNRLITYECATVGVKNGLAIEHMAAVLSRSSGSNSASVNVLPVLGSRGRTADVPLGPAVDELKRASQLGMQCGAPMLFANLACSLYQAAASQFGATASIDEVARMFEACAGIDFADADTWEASAA